jgi:penicillin-binding protein 1C
MAVLCRIRVRTWIAGGCLAALAVACWTLGGKGPAIPSFEEVRSRTRPSDAVLLDRNGLVIHEARVESRFRRLEWAALGDISPALRRAVIRAEDRRFYRHGGADWISMASALLGSLRADGLRGASTITMQLAARLLAELGPSGGRRTLRQKVRQIRAALALERQWSKDEILEAYLNLVSFRGELEGIGAAAAGLFQKAPQGLDERESVVLAALIRAPNAPAGQVGARARALAADLSLRCDPDEIDALVARTLGRAYSIRPRVALAPHVAQRLLAPAAAGGERPASLRTTLDAGLQRFVLETLRRQLYDLSSQNVSDGAVLVVENAGGRVLAYVGNAGNNSRAVHVDGVRARRQAGSTLKPFLYAAALERRLLTAATLIDDSPLEIPVAGGIFRPKNYDRLFRGPVTVRVALASSLNVPAVRTLNLLGVEPFVGKLASLGFGDLARADFYGPSLALGSADVTLWELVGAYRCLASGGLMGPMTLLAGDRREPARRVIDAGAAFIVSDILADREGRSRTFSLESPLATRFWTAVKTGTSTDMRDNWCIGYSERYTVGVWTGNFSGEPMWNVSGVTGAAPVWVEVMNYLHRDLASGPPAAPAGVTRRRVRMADSGRPWDEWFMAGTETDRIMPVSPAAGCRIAYPADGTVIALDPDIPPEEQKVFFEARPASPGLRWLLNGREVGRAGRLQLWAPQRGAYRLALVDGADRTLDTITFVVR